MKLKAKFILPTIALIIAGMSITTWFTYQRSTDSLQEISLEMARTNLASLLSTVDLWIEDTRNEVLSISHTATIVAAAKQSASESEALAAARALLADVVSRHPNYDNLFLIDAKGVILTSSNDSLTGKDFAAREYFRKAMEGRPYLSSPLLSADKGEPVFVVAVPVGDGGKPLGVLVAGIRLGLFTKEFVDPLTSAKGYASVASADGLILAHPQREFVGKRNIFKDAAYGSRIATQSAGSLDVVEDGQRRIILFKRSEHTGWVVGMVVNANEAFADARHLGLAILAMSGGIVLIFVCGVWAILSINVLRPVGALVAAASRIADGDLDTALGADRRDEIGSLQRAMAKMVENLKGKIGEAESKESLAAAETEKARQATAEAEEARRQAEHARQAGMLQAADQLEGIVSAVDAATGDISSQLAQSSQGSQEQSNRIGETATSMEEMNATVLAVAQSASDAAETADQARRTASDGSDIVTRVIRSIGEVQAKALSLKGDMRELGQQAEGIGRIMSVISDIADQTNLLALNAAIEAARAGEAGRGFAVVADEVRKLAEKTMAATKEVGEAIGSIQHGTRQNIDNVELAAKRIDEATALAGQSGETLAAIVGLVDRTTDQVRAIATAAEQQSITTEEINRSIADINRLAGESAQAQHHSANVVAELAGQTKRLRSLIDGMQSATDVLPGLPAAGPLRLVGNAGK
ncbi:methyl-accepting chemotaxis protein [Solidesulfovibrio sp.]|uniref:methyl-accepting chemotaxis protein n=1 Tax=Solidesulfovibrio sp. TaxID=2910990 RepID=UPI0026252CA8|nr:methyl-accepting chemotaxis protein [Solidesulfovibrio sp.]